MSSVCQRSNRCQLPLFQSWRPVPSRPWRMQFSVSLALLLRISHESWWLFQLQTYLACWSRSRSRRKGACLDWSIHATALSRHSRPRTLRKGLTQLLAGIRALIVWRSGRRWLVSVAQHCLMPAEPYFCWTDCHAYVRVNGNWAMNFSNVR